ncbi:MAG: GNAT family N-acetyltransferase [Actinobacteria bacterium]|nr:GNAT family N-acetyltransferase [Actinomycetota bacterium]
MTSMVEALAWDTEFWGVATARVVVADGETPAALSALLTTAMGEFKFLQVLLPLDAVGLIVAAEECGFRFADVRCLLDIPENMPLPNTSGEPSFVAASGDVLSAAAELAARSHSISRFVSDASLDPQATSDLYRRWVLRDAGAHGWEVDVVLDGSDVLGYVTYGVDSAGEGSIGLIGVAEAARGSGLGNALASRAVLQCRAAGARRMTVVTQAGNASAMRMYRSVGFGVVSMGCWLHWHLGSQG